MQTELEIINRKVCMNQPLEIVFEEFAQRCGVEEIQNFSEVLSFCKTKRWKSRWNYTEYGKEYQQ